MAKFLYSIGRSAYLHRLRFLAVWLVLLVAVGGTALAVAKPTSNSFSIPWLDSVITQKKMQERFPDAGDATETPSGTIVVRAGNGKTLKDPAVAAQVDKLVAELRGASALTDREAIADPVRAAAGLAQQLTKAQQQQQVPQAQIEKNIAQLSPLSPDERTGTIAITFDADKAVDIDQADRDAVTAILERHRSGDLEVFWSGNAFNAITGLSVSSELIGLAVAAVVLLVTFGSLVTAGMPLVSAIVGVALGLLGVQIATSMTDAVGDMTPALASMIGLAVGIDYALFIVSRFRSEVIRLSGGGNPTPGEVAQRLRAMTRAERAHAMGLAVGKAGSAVVFAGTTVIIALVALSIINIPFLTVMALAAAGTVVLAVLVALTFLPALAGLFGSGIFAARVPGVRVPDPEAEKPTMGLRWVRRIRARPWLHLVIGVVALAILAIPAANLRLAMPTDGSATPGTPERQAHDAIAEAFGPGRNAPMVALVDAAGVDQAKRPEAVADALALALKTEGVENAQVVATTKNMDTAQILITPKFDANDERTSVTLDDLRNQRDAFADRTGASYGITGITPIFDDISAQLLKVLLPYIGIVLALAFIVLMLVFRSIWVPLIAALGFGLSVAATFGVTVATYQEGWLGLVNDPQPLISFLPIILIGLVFGLAMDYQVFLVTRMREGWANGKTAGNATSNGFKHGARVVTAAALIMIAVFAAFTLQDMPFIKSMGFALATAIVLDAFVVRMMIIPATMFLLGERAWWLPRWLDRILPKLDIEGEALTEAELSGHEQQSGAEQVEQAGEPAAVTTSR